MTSFESCLTALKQPGPPEAFFKAIDKALAEVVGHKLFTLLYVAPDGKRVKRLYTNMPKAYPVGGYKPVTESDWHKLVIGQRRAWVGYDYEDVNHEPARRQGALQGKRSGQDRAVRRPDDRPLPWRHRCRSRYREEVGSLSR
jgi:hypothetical protein